jgi:hypothetical protein
MFTRIARDRLKDKFSYFDLPIVHALLILSTVAANNGDSETAATDSNTAVRYVYGLQLNYETTHMDNNDGCSYLTEVQVGECCRRTFWTLVGVHPRLDMVSDARRDRHVSSTKGIFVCRVQMALMTLESPRRCR